MMMIHYSAYAHMSILWAQKFLKGIELVSLHTFPLNPVLHSALGSLAHRLKVSIYLGIFCQLKESLVCAIAEYPRPANAIRIIVWVQIPVNVSETDLNQQKQE